MSINLIISQTSWTGAVNDKWSKSYNWSNGVPNSNKDAIIGDAYFTGPNQPVLDKNGKCSNLTIGDGAIVSTLGMKKSLTIYGNLLIEASGTINANKNKTITIKGNWTNNGTYLATDNSAKVTFSGTTHTLNGITTFKKIKINSGASLNLASNIIIGNEIEVDGTLNPTDSYTVSGVGKMNLDNNGRLMVYAENFSDNYTLSGTYSMDKYSYVNYASATITQYISNAYTYNRLEISGGSTKELTTDLPALKSNNYSTGRIYIYEGILDLKTYKADRGTGSGGYFYMSEGTTLKIGGTNGFPANYAVVTTSSTSTVEYYGNDQVIKDCNYGNLIFTATSGAVTKTMPNTQLSIYGDFTASKGTGTNLQFTAQSNIDFKKNFTMGSDVIFDGSSRTITFRGDYVNNGTYTGSTSLCYFRGVGANLSGTGTNNFYYLKFRAAGIEAESTVDINVASHLSVDYGGEFTHNNGGTVTMTGTTKSIIGNDMSLYNLDIQGSITNNYELTIRGDFNCDGSLTTGSGSVISLNGTNKSITGTGSISFYRLYVNGSYTTARDLTIRRDIYVFHLGSFTATAGTATFSYYSTLSGAANFYNINILSGKTLRLAADSRLGIASTLTAAGNLSMTSYTPNTVSYNGVGNQNVVEEYYYNLELSNGGVKTATGDIDVMSDITIDSGVELDASSTTIALAGDWVNNGTFTAGTSTVEFDGSTASEIYGETTFNILEVDKSSAGTHIHLFDDITSANVIMTAGTMLTEDNELIINNSRTGNGYIYGTITHAHSFTDGTNYSFEGPQNYISFSNPSVDLSSVTIKVVLDEVSDFDPAIESVMREYQITIPSGTYTNANIRFHYEDDELNAFEEPFLTIYKYNSGVTWDSIGYSSRSTTNNYVEYASLTNLLGRYSFSGTRRILEW